MTTEEIVLSCPSCDELVTPFPFPGGGMKWRCTVHGLTSFPVEERYKVNRSSAVTVAAGPISSLGTANGSAPTVGPEPIAQTEGSTEGHCACHDCERGRCHYCPDCGLDKAEPLRWDSSAPGRDGSDDRFVAIMEELYQLHKAKDHDYSPYEYLGNYRAAAEFGVAPSLGAMLRVSDKIERMKTFYESGNLYNESALDALNDIAVGAIVTRILLEEELQCDVESVGDSVGQPVDAGHVPPADGASVRPPVIETQPDGRKDWTV